MKTKGMFVEIRAYRNQKEPDNLNNTAVYVNGRDFWPVYENGVYTPPKLDELKVGDKLELAIPSGGIKGTVREVEIEERKIVLYDAEWDGLAGGLDHGLSGFGDFDAMGGLVTESSILPEGASIPYVAYECIRKLVSEMAYYREIGLSPEAKGDLMATIYSVLDELLP